MAIKIKKMTIEQEIQVLSFAKTAKKIVNSIPGVEANIDFKESKLKLKIVNETAVSNFFQSPISDARESLKHYEVDLRYTTDYINSLYKNHIYPNFPDWGIEFRKYCSDISLITVAEQYFNASADANKIVQVNHGLIKNLDILAIATVVLMNIENSIKDFSNPFNSYNAVKAVGKAVKEVLNNEFGGLYLKIEELEYLLDCANVLKGRINFDFNSYLRGFQERLLIFLISHEVGHLASKHHEHPSLIHQDTKFIEVADTKYIQEYEADLFACCVMNKFCESHEISKEIVGLEIAFSSALMALTYSPIVELNPKNFTYQGYPGAFPRFIYLTEAFVSNWTDKPVKEKYADAMQKLVLVQNVCRDFINN